MMVVDHKVYQIRSSARVLTLWLSTFKADFEIIQLMSNLRIWSLVITSYGLMPKESKIHFVMHPYLGTYNYIQRAALAWQSEKEQHNRFLHQHRPKSWPLRLKSSSPWCERQIRHFVCTREFMHRRTPFFVLSFFSAGTEYSVDNDIEVVT